MKESFKGDTFFRLAVLRCRQENKELATSLITAVPLRSCEKVGCFLDQSVNTVAHANVWICSNFHKNNMERFSLTLWTILVTNLITTGEKYNLRLLVVHNKPIMILEKRKKPLIQTKAGCLVEVTASTLQALVCSWDWGTTVSSSNFWRAFRLGSAKLYRKAYK